MNLGISANLNSTLAKANNYQRPVTKSQPYFGALNFNPDEFRVLEKPDVVDYAREAYEILKGLKSLSKFDVRFTPHFDPLLQTRGMEITATSLKTPPSNIMEKVVDLLNPQTVRTENAQLSGVSLRSASHIITCVKKLASRVLNFEDNKLFLEELENKIGQFRRVA